MNARISMMTIAMLGCVSTAPAGAQALGRPQDGFVSQSYSGQYFGQYSGRVDGRGGHREGFPPSAADKFYTTFDYAISSSDCDEVDAFAPSARPGWQARVRSVCR
jgi:hypothetical protein